jgi:fructose-bisphosphate aldolase, class I
MCVGTPAQERDFAQFHQIREDAERLRMPLIVWANPRGAAIEAKGGKNSFDAVDYAARAASELGADVVKVNFPNPEMRDAVKEPYRAEFSSQRAIDAVVRSANRTLLLVSGGERAGDEAMLEKARESMEAGATGLIWGRNVWQRTYDESLQFVARVQEILAEYPSDSQRDRSGARGTAMTEDAADGQRHRADGQPAGYPRSWVADISPPLEGPHV